MSFSIYKPIKMLQFLSFFVCLDFGACMKIKDFLLKELSPDEKLSIKNFVDEIEAVK